MRVDTKALLVVLIPALSLKHTFGFSSCDKPLFCIDSRVSASMSKVQQMRPPQRLTAPFGRVAGTKTMLHAERKKDTVSYDGSDRGRYILVLVLFICIWQFSIPPTFRRAKFCPTACAKERTLCRKPCVTIEEWTSDVVQYYKNGGGIQWDFTIDPNTVAENEKFVQNLFGRK